MRSLIARVLAVIAGALALSAAAILIFSPADPTTPPKEH